VVKISVVYLTYQTKQKQRAMNTVKTINATYNKIVTVIEGSVAIVNGKEVEKGGKVFTFSKKSNFYNWAKLQDSMAVRVSQNINGFVNKMKSLGFDVEVDESFGFDHEVKAYCNKMM